MNFDMIWQIARYILIAGFSYLTAKGWIAAENVEAVIGAIGTLAAAVWGIYVKAGTSAVPTIVAERIDAPMVSGATGATK